MIKDYQQNMLFEHHNIMFCILYYGCIVLHCIMDILTPFWRPQVKDFACRSNWIPLKSDVLLRSDYLVCFFIHTTFNTTCVASSIHPFKQKTGL